MRAGVFGGGKFRYKRLGPDWLLTFFCPGCCVEHSAIIGKTGFKISGLADRPTLDDTFRIRHREPMVGGTPEKPELFEEVIDCELELEDGKIRFGDECGHVLKNVVAEPMTLPGVKKP